MTMASQPPIFGASQPPVSQAPVSQPTSFGTSGNLWGSSTTVSGQSTSAFGVPRKTKTPKQTIGNSAIFPTTTPQHKRSHKTLFGGPKQAIQTPVSLFGTTTPQTTNDIPSFTPQTIPPQATQTNQSRNPTNPQLSFFSIGRSTTPASPSPISRSRSSISRSSVSSGTVTPATSFTSQSQSTARESTPRPFKTYTDPNGDLCLTVGPQATEFVVCSKTMARSSPFFKKMLYGAFSEGKKAQPGSEKSDWVVKLPEDNVAAMTIILNIIHGRFDKVPGYEDFVYTTHFYNLCVLTDKYDMAHVLRPWAKGWSRSTHNQCEKLGQSLRTKFCHERLWISWELGDRVAFESMAKGMLMNSSASAGNNLRYVGALEPPEIYERIEKVRLDTITSLLKPLNDIIGRLVRNDVSFCRQCDSFNKNRCLALTLGKIIQALHRHGLWPLPESLTDLPYSVSTLAQKLHLIETEINKDSHHNSLFASVDSVRTEVENTLNAIPSLLTETHLKHLAAQAKKTGFATPEALMAKS
ncbi:hypothetical protein F5Y00DRAFT_203732 [Daldinia vernicosa]|uniref:uncharacterized protein n=1 Tax=Daldinia vernicosa TaxID=114800 RepID=UPI002008942E|nr:uncharacterized protein F5Y00DRAFT_203732 [Daldinia vernicosa]KAI0851935.1 hypothetical protein F5Y00DRAFT_203732 [Daldinia vernicosa]